MDLSSFVVHTFHQKDSRYLPVWIESRFDILNWLRISDRTKIGVVYSSNALQGCWSRLHEFSFVYFELVTVCPTDIGPTSREYIPYSFMYSNFRVREIKNHPIFVLFFAIKILNLNMLVLYHSWSICHVPWVIWFESGLRNIDFRRGY